MNAIERKLVEINQRLNKFKVLKDNEIIIDNLALFMTMAITDANSYLNEVYAVPIYIYKYKKLLQFNVIFNYLIFFLKQYKNVVFWILSIPILNWVVEEYTIKHTKNKEKFGRYYDVRY